MVSVGKETASVILVLGAGGMLGTTLCLGLSTMGYRVLRQSRRAGTDVCFDPLDVDAVAIALAEYRPDVVVNLIAESNVDACQLDMRQAYLANVRTVESLVSASAVELPTAHLIQMSTDHVYDGAGPHKESDVLPCNAYALTKYAGELVALRAGATVIRTNFFGCSRSKGRKSFSDWVVSSLKSGIEFTVFDDVYFSALHMTTLTQCVAQSIRQRHCGVFNVGCKDGVSKAGFAQLLASRLGLDTAAMKIGSIKDVLLSAPRPCDMRMDVRSFERSFGVEMPGMAQQIELAVDEYKEF